MTAKRTASPKAAPRKTAPRTASTRKTAPRTASTRKAASHKTAPRRGGSRTAATRKTAPHKTTPRKTAAPPKASAPRKTATSRETTATASSRLAEFMARYTPEIAAFGRRQLNRLRRRLPTAHAMVYDNYNGLVIGFGPTERPSEAILSLLLLPDHVTLCFLQGAFLDDPTGILKGSGNQVRHIRLEDDATMDRPEVRGLVEQAIEECEPPFAASGAGPLVIRAVSAKQRPRRP